jgi:hypothetical protein
MRKFISFTLAGNLLVIIMLLLLVFHILILLKVVPSDIVWGGQVSDPSSDMIILEIIALLVTLIFLFILAEKMEYIRFIKNKKVINTGIWIIFIYMIFNTIGNLTSAISVENLIFSPIAVIVAILALRLAIEK